MRPEVKENLGVVARTLVFILGSFLFVVGLLDLVVGGASLRNVAFLVLGAALAGTPLFLAFRQALRAARMGKRS